MATYTVASALLLSKTIQSDSARLDAELLLAYVLNKSRTWLYTWPEKTLSDQQFQAFSQLVVRRSKGEPVAYLVGQQEFWSLPLKVSPATLIPRADTERLVEAVLDYIDQCDLQAPAILDLGCGTGAIALALASELPNARILGLDKVEQAVALSQENAKALAINHASFAQSDWFTYLESNALDKQKPVNTHGTVSSQLHNNTPMQFDIILSNPPYIDKDDVHLTQGDVVYEPKSALVADKNGLSDIQYIIEHSPRYLRPSAALFFEHGWQQGETVKTLLEKQGFVQCETCQDIAGHDRVTFGQWV